MIERYWHDDIVSQERELTEAERVKIREWFEPNWRRLKSSTPLAPKLSQTMPEQEQEEVKLPDPMPDWFEAIIGIIDTNRGEGERWRQEYQTHYLTALRQDKDPLLHMIQAASRDGRHHLTSFLRYLNIKQFMPNTDDAKEIATWLEPRAETLREVLEQRFELVKVRNERDKLKEFYQLIETHLGIAKLKREAQTEKDRAAAWEKERDTQALNCHNLNKANEALTKLNAELRSEIEALKAADPAARIEQSIDKALDKLEYKIMRPKATRQRKLKPSRKKAAGPIATD